MKLKIFMASIVLAMATSVAIAEDEAPVDEAPAAEMPADEAPAAEMPADEAPAAEAPAAEAGH